MPVAAVTSVLAAGLLPLFVPETAPATTPDAADQWAKAYTDYIVAGGISAVHKQSAFAAALTTAFNPELAGGGPPLFIQALQVFWLGLPVPQQGGTVVLFTPTTTNVDSPQPDDATPQDQADALAQVLSSFTLGAVKVQVGPPGPIVPLA